MIATCVRGTEGRRHHRGVQAHREPAEAEVGTARGEDGAPADLGPRDLEASRAEGGADAVEVGVAVDGQQSLKKLEKQSATD